MSSPNVGLDDMEEVQLIGSREKKRKKNNFLTNSSVHVGHITSGVLLVMFLIGAIIIGVLYTNVLQLESHLSSMYKRLSIAQDILPQTSPRASYPIDSPTKSLISISHTKVPSPTERPMAPTPLPDFYDFDHPTERPTAPTPPPDLYDFDHPTERPTAPTPPPDLYDFDHPTERPTAPTPPPDSYDFDHPTERPTPPTPPPRKFDFDHISAPTPPTPPPRLFDFDHISSPTPFDFNKLSTTPSPAGPIFFHPAPTPPDEPVIIPDFPFDITLLRRQIRGQQRVLDEYYFPHDAHKHVIYLKPGDPRYEQGLDYIADKMARAFVWSDKFVISTMGSSVVAGHDNCAYDSYQNQLERLIKPLWEFARVSLEIRNAGITGHCGDTHQNMVWCIRNVLGDDTDIAHYEWTYMENPRTEKDLNHERWLRWLLLMERSPPGHIFSVATGKEFDCLKQLDSSGKIPDVYGKFGANILCLEEGLKVQGYVKKIHEKTLGDGMHKTTRYGEIENAARRKSLGSVFRNWHPGPLGFQMIADAFAYYYGNAMLRALNKIENISIESPINPFQALKKTWPRAPLALHVRDLPDPIFCNPQFCNQLPNCLDVEAPTFGESRITLAAHGEWEKYNDPVTVLIPSQEKSLAKCKHKDHCSALQSRGTHSGYIWFAIPPLSVGHIIICNLKHSPKWKEFNNDGLEIKLKKVEDGSEIVLVYSEFKEIFQKCLLIQDKFPLGQMGQSFTDAPLELGIMVKSSKTLQISHVIAI